MIGRVNVRKLKSQHGTAIVETALTLLPFFVFIFALVEAGWFFYVQATLTHAAREGAKIATRPITQTNTLMDQTEVRTYVAPFLAPIGVNCPSCITLTPEQVNVCAEVPGCDADTVPQPFRTAA